jgi:hypothetical protein
MKNTDASRTTASNQTVGKSEAVAAASPTHITPAKQPADAKEEAAPVKKSVRLLVREEQRQHRDEEGPREDRRPNHSKHARFMEEKIELLSAVQKTRHQGAFMAASTMRKLLANYRHHLPDAFVRRAEARVAAKKGWRQDEWMGWRKKILEGAEVEVPEWLRSASLDIEDEDKVESAEAPEDTGKTKPEQAEHARPRRQAGQPRRRDKRMEPTRTSANAERWIGGRGMLRPA